MKKIFTLTFLLSVICATVSAQSGVRFLNRVFTDIQLSDGILYSTVAPVTDENNLESLYFDFYEPVDDTMSRRPLVILVFGGAFVGGGRQWIDMVSFADSLCHYGYTVASIDYRLLSLLRINETNFIRDAYGAAQDVSAAIRFFKGNADTYRIDTNQIFLMGNSAGTIASMHAVWMDDNERPVETYEDEGGLFGIGAHHDLGGIHTAGYEEFLSYSPRVAGLIAQWGGVLDTNIINSDDQTPVCFIHGTADESVSFYSGVPYESNFLGISTLVLPVVYGSYFLNQRCNSLGIDHEFHIFEGEEHCFYLDGWTTLLPEKLDTCFRIALNFMARYNTHIQWPSQIVESATNQVSIFPNPAKENVRIRLENLDTHFTYLLTDLCGKTIQVGENEQIINVSKLPNGIYLLQINTDNFTHTEKIIKE